MARRWVALLMAALMLVLLSGCGMKSPEELYRLPKPSTEYQSLQSELEKLQNQGYEFAAPLAGSNTQSVQMEDLNGDGQDEAIAVFRDSSGENKPMKICIFRMDGDGGYELATMIEGDGDAVNSIAYCQMNDTEALELVVGWHISSTVFALSVYSIDNFNVTELMSAPNYSRYMLRDLDQDNQMELALFQLATVEEGGNTVTYFNWTEDTLMQINTVPLSTAISAIQSIDYGALFGGYPALYVNSIHQDSPNELVTDILAVRDDSLTNITMDNGMDNSDTAHANITGLTDINNDNILELPMATPLQSSTMVENSESFSVIDWRQYTLIGKFRSVGMSYHNIADGWYLMLPHAWEQSLNELILGRSDVSVGATIERTITFYHVSSGGEPQPFMAIYKNTGANRQSRAEMGSRTLIWETSDATYAAEFFESDWDCGLDADTVGKSFHLIVTDWSTD